MAREHPITTVCKWIGNTVAIAARHYVQVTDHDFQMAVQGDETPKDKALQNVLQYTPKTARKGLHKKQQNPVIPEGNEVLLECAGV